MTLESSDSGLRNLPSYSGFRPAITAVAIWVELPHRITGRGDDMLIRLEFWGYWRGEGEVI